jgi:hypothetical protein
MVSPAEWYSAISVGSSAVAVGLAAYVTRRMPNRRAGDAFVMSMVFFLLASVVRGPFAGDLDAEMRAFVWRAERRYGELLERWDDDVEEVSGVRAMTARLFL